MHLLSIFPEQKGKIITMKLQETFPNFQICLACLCQRNGNKSAFYSFITSSVSTVFLKRHISIAIIILFSLSGNLDFRFGDNTELKTTLLFILLEMNGMNDMNTFTLSLSSTINY